MKILERLWKHALERWQHPLNLAQKQWERFGNLMEHIYRDSSAWAKPTSEPGKIQQHRKHLKFWGWSGMLWGHP